MLAKKQYSFFKKMIKLGRQVLFGVAIFFNSQNFCQSPEIGLSQKVAIKQDVTGSNMQEYKVNNQIKPQALAGISVAQIEDHWKLYEGYVAQVNRLSKELADLRAQNQVESAQYADRRRRYGFELNGLVLHEYYFSVLTTQPEKTARPAAESPLHKAIVASWGSFEAWQKDFESAGKTRGIGWAILYVDTETKALSNHFIAEHENGHIAGWMPILVLDVWEHAYMLDYKAGGRGQYIQAFVNNIDWRKTEARYQDVLVGKIPSRI